MGLNLDKSGIIMLDLDSKPPDQSLSPLCYQNFSYDSNYSKLDIMLASDNLGFELKMQKVVPICTATDKIGEN